MRFVFSLLAALALTACVDPKGADTFSSGGVLSGSILTQQDCAAFGDTAVWVTVDGRGECQRYFHSGFSDDTETAQIFFHGDWMIQWLDGRARVPDGYSSRATPASRQSRADGAASATGQPFIFFSRPGVFGSTGEHKRRRLARESQIISAALDAIKARHGLTSLTLSGQSGGGHVVASLLTLRDDVDCAAIASGVVSVRDRSRIRGWGGQDITGFTSFFDPIRHIGSIPADTERRIFVVGDPQDSNTPFSTQQAYYTAVADAGHAISLIKSRGGGRARHALADTGIAVAGACMSGAPTVDITGRYSTL